MSTLVVFSTVFGLIFLAEVGDKSQLMTMSLGCRYQWRPVFCGVVAALAAVTGVGIALGVVVFRILPPFYIELIAGIAFLVFGVWTLVRDEREVTGRRDATAAQCGCRDPVDASGRSVERGSRSSPWSTFGASFSLTVAAEFGDKTQVAVITLTASTAAPLAVFFGSLAAFIAVTAIGLLVGVTLLRHLPERWVKIGSGALFIAFGIWFLASAWLM